MIVDVLESRRQKSLRFRWTIHRAVGSQHTSHSGQHYRQNFTNRRGKHSRLYYVAIVLRPFAQAYMLYGGGGGGGSGSGGGNSFNAAVIDTIVAEIQSVPGEDRCVLLLGYEGKMREMFQVSLSLTTLWCKSNPNLSTERK